MRTPVGPDDPAATPATPPAATTTDAAVDRAGLPAVGRRRGKSQIVTWAGAGLLALVMGLLFFSGDDEPKGKKAKATSTTDSRITALVVPETPPPMTMAKVPDARAALLDTQPLAAQKTTPAATAAAPTGPRPQTWWERKMDNGDDTSGGGGQASGDSGAPDLAENTAPRKAAPKKAPSSSGLSDDQDVVKAQLMGDPDYMLTMGTPIDCILDTKLISTLAGMMTCHLDADVWSESNRVKLWDKGARVVGHYSGGVKYGEGRIAVTLQRVQSGRVKVLVNSGATDALGASGLDGYVDNKWDEKIGVALGVATLEGAVGIATARAGGNGGQQNLILGGTTTAGSKVSEEILKSTLNVASVMEKQPGEHIKFLLAKDVLFDVYELELKSEE